MSTDSSTLNPNIAEGAFADSETLVHRNVQASKSHAIQAAEELKAAAEAKAKEWAHVAEEKATEFKHKAEVAVSDAKVRIEEIQKETENYVRENPLKALVAALGVGFLIGFLSRR